MAVMNERQYGVVKFMCGFPFFNTKKFAKMIKVDHSEVLRVQASSNFEQYQDNDTPLEDLMSMFGGGNPFGGRK